MDSEELGLAADGVKLTDCEGVRCETCFYWTPIAGAKAGTCRALPPRAAPPDCEPEWPITGPEDGCGYWHTDQQPPAHLGLAEYSEPELEDAKCRVCGCTEIRACPGGCSWVEADLCSQCAARDPKYSQQTIDEVQRRQVAAGLPPFAPDVIERVQHGNRAPEDRLPPGAAPKDVTGADV